MKACTTLRPTKPPKLDKHGSTTQDGLIAAPPGFPGLEIAAARRRREAGRGGTRTQIFRPRGRQAGATALRRPAHQDPRRHRRRVDPDRGSHDRRRIARGVTRERSGAFAAEGSDYRPLSATDPNPSFIQQSEQQLKAAGYSVDYYPPERITVDFYRKLPKHNYRIVLIRSHSTGTLASTAGGDSATQFAVGLFTNEPYRHDEYIGDQIAHRLTADVYVDRGIESRFFGITADFVTEAMQGRFDGATIILMGCNGLSTDDMARAFVARGAQAFVSWDREVTAEHTDAATGALLSNLLGQHLDLPEAIARTMQQTGADPVFGARLLEYP